MANELKPCPKCNGKLLKKVHILSRRLPWWWYIECWNCHYCGKTKLFYPRAIKAWNRRWNDGRKTDVYTEDH